MAENFGKCLGYCSEPCPNCGRYRLEQYENNKRVCEKCGWCPEDNAYADPYEYENEKEREEYKCGL